MSFFEDLSVYDYLPTSHEVMFSARNAGWLEPGCDFPRGPVEAWTVDALWAHCRYIVGPTRGVFDCPFCSGEPVCSYVHHGERRMLGTGEIRIFAGDGSGFASPNLVFHYVRDHSYQMPDVVISALLDGPKPGSADYERLLNACGLHWRHHPTIPAEPRRIRL